MELEINLTKQNIVNDVAAELNLYGRTLELSAAGQDKAADSLRELANYIRTPDDNETKPIVARSMQEAWNAVKECCQRFLTAGRHYDDNRLEAITSEVRKTHSYEQSKFPCNTENPSFPVISLLRIPFMQANTTYKLQVGCSGTHNNPGTLILVVGNKAVGEFTLGDEETFQYKAENTEENVLVSIQKKDISMPDISLEQDAVFTFQYTYPEYGVYNLQLGMPNNFNISVTSSITSHAHRLIVDTVVAAVLKNQQQDGYAKYLTTAEKARQDLIRCLQARNSFGRVQHDWT